MRLASCFDPVTHTYYNRAGVRRRSVTQVLGSQGLIDYSDIDPSVLEHARARGERVHHSTAQFDTDGWIDESSIAPEDEGYFAAWCRFRSESGLKVYSIEEPMITRVAGIEVGGTPDRIGYLNGFRAIVDLKCCATPMPAWALQLALYEMMLVGWPRCDEYLRASVQLFPTGRYNVRYYSDASDSDAAIAALVLANWDDQANDRDADTARKTLNTWKHNHRLDTAA